MRALPSVECSSGIQLHERGYCFFLFLYRLFLYRCLFLLLVFAALRALYSSSSIPEIDSIAGLAKMCLLRSVFSRYWDALTCALCRVCVVVFSSYLFCRLCAPSRCTTPFGGTTRVGVFLCIRPVNWGHTGGGKDTVITRSTLDNIYSAALLMLVLVRMTSRAGREVARPHLELQFFGRRTIFKTKGLGMAEESVWLGDSGHPPIVLLILRLRAE